MKTYNVKITDKGEHVAEFQVTADNYKLALEKAKARKWWLRAYGYKMRVTLA